MASSSDSEPPCKRRFIIKFSYPQKQNGSSSPSSGKKQIITCYWLPKNSTTTTSTVQENSSKVDNVQTTVKKSVAVVVADPKVSSKPPTTILKPQKLRKVCVDDVSLAARNEKRRPLLVKQQHRRNRVDQGLCASTSKNGFAKTGLIKKENQKKPIEHYKKMQCWVILKRMIEGRDGWALKNPLNQKYLKGLEKNKAIGLKDIEAKLKSSYSTTDEFAKDMRFVFSHGLLYHPKNIVHRIAMKFSEIFENKWKSLNEEWTLEEKRLKHKIHKRKRELSVSPKYDTLSMILKEQSKMFDSFKERSRKIR